MQDPIRNAKHEAFLSIVTVENESSLLRSVSEITVNKAEQYIRDLFILNL